MNTVRSLDNKSSSTKKVSGMTIEETDEFCPWLGTFGNLKVEDCDEIITHICTANMLLTEKCPKLSGVRCYHLERKGEYFVNRNCDCVKVNHQTLEYGNQYFKHSDRVQKLLNQNKLEYNYYPLYLQEEVVSKARKSGKLFVINPYR